MIEGIIRTIFGTLTFDIANIQPLKWLIGTNNLWYCKATNNDRLEELKSYHKVSPVWVLWWGVVGRICTGDTMGIRETNKANERTRCLLINRGICISTYLILVLPFHDKRHASGAWQKSHSFEIYIHTHTHSHTHTRTHTHTHTHTHTRTHTHAHACTHAHTRTHLANPQLHVSALLNISYDIKHNPIFWYDWSENTAIICGMWSAYSQYINIHVCVIILYFDCLSVLIWRKKFQREEHIQPANIGLNFELSNLIRHNNRLKTVFNLCIDCCNTCVYGTIPCIVVLNTKSSLILL